MSAPEPLPEQRERRAGERHVTVLMIGRAERNGRQQACIIRNMSARGLMARFASVPAVGESVVVECRVLPATLAVVRWVRGDAAGLEFVRCVAQAPAGMRDPRLHVSRGPRFGLATAAKLQQGSRGRVGRLLNLSAGGACIEGEVDTAPGEAVALTLPHLLGMTPARVVWRDAGRIGISFHTPLLFPSLSRIVLAL